MERLQIRITGIVQGVGFRPFIFRLAKQLQLPGWIRNDGMGVTLEVEGPHDSLLEFLGRIQTEKPTPAFLYAVDHRFLVPAGFQSFEIRESEKGGSLQAWILPDLAVCSNCRSDFLDPANRRYRYPFTNCTHCGPRFTIIESLPYDRPGTSMKTFVMCNACDREYHDPEDRRFHAQPNACSSCGPLLKWQTGDASIGGEEALQEAVRRIRAGGILAVKGLGGYHLIADATNENAVAELRRRKKRRNKPFAVMYPDSSMLEAHVHVPEFARPMLASTQAPILLLNRKEESYRRIAPSVAPHSPRLGVFLPYTPLHQLLLSDLGTPIVATSGNLSEEPIQFDDQEAARELGHLWDGMLLHNRPIVHHADDSVLHVLERPEARLQMLRRARGYTPLPLLAPRELPPLLALGGHKNVTIALSRGHEIILSQHLGDLESLEARRIYEKTLHDFLQLYEVKPIAVVHDLHPDYFTTRFASSLGIPLIGVQHHHAHMAACMLENQIEGAALGIAWDGTGYGPDHTVWGGEFLAGTPARVERFATLFPFSLPGGETAVEQPWRVALAVLQQCFGNDIPRELPLFQSIPQPDISMVLKIAGNRRFSPITTSAGRLFDAVSAIFGLAFENTHQAEAAQLLEYAAWRATNPADVISIPFENGSPIRLDWRSLIRSLTTDFLKGTPVEQLAATFHLSLASAAAGVAKLSQQKNVVLSGGVFCNRYLTEHLLMNLAGQGLQAYIHTQLPPTDGCLAAGQLWSAAHQLVSGL